MEKYNVISDFDEFRSLNEERGLTLFNFAANQFGSQIVDSAKQTIVLKILEYFGVKPEGGDFSEWIKEVITKLVAGLSGPEMDKLLFGSQKFSDADYWCPKLAKAITETLIDGYPSVNDVINWMGLDKDKFLGRLVLNTYRETFTDEETVEQMIRGIWNLVSTTEFIPRKDANEIYDKAYSKLTPAQKKKIEGTTWQSSMKQADILRGKKS
jgi:hypothetical protein